MDPVGGRRMILELWKVDYSGPFGSPQSSYLTTDRPDWNEALTKAKELVKPTGGISRGCLWNIAHLGQVSTGEENNQANKDS